MRFGDSSLQHLLLGIKDYDKISRNQDWFAKWEEEGRRYKLERRSNNASTFLHCSVRDAKWKKVRYMYPERERFGEGLETYDRETPISRSGS